MQKKPASDLYVGDKIVFADAGPTYAVTSKGPHPHLKDVMALGVSTVEKNAVIHVPRTVEVLVTYMPRAYRVVCIVCDVEQEVIIDEANYSLMRRIICLACEHHVDEDKLAAVKLTPKGGS